MTEPERAEALAAAALKGDNRHMTDESTNEYDQMRTQFDAIAAREADHVELERLRAVDLERCREIEQLHEQLATAERALVGSTEAHAFEADLAQRAIAAVAVRDDLLVRLYRSRSPTLVGDALDIEIERVWSDAPSAALKVRPMREVADEALTLLRDMMRPGHQP